MQIKQRTLYNLLRMNALLDPVLRVESWQVEDYRLLPFDVLFDRLKRFDIALNDKHFIFLGENFDTPEEFAEHLLSDRELSAKEQDQVYLLIFEVWRRLFSEKPCLSIFADELDHLIYSYDSKNTSSLEPLMDALANLKSVLDENVDSGCSPGQAFLTVSESLANDLESFLYDFISDQIESQNISYASELIENFSPYVCKAKWFDLLKAAIFSESNPKMFADSLRQITLEAMQEKDVDFNLELLALMIPSATAKAFTQLAKHTLSFIKQEDDFQDLISMIADFFHRLDDEKKEQALLKLLDARKAISADRPLSRKDPAWNEVAQLLPCGKEKS